MPPRRTTKPAAPPSLALRIARLTGPAVAAALAPVRARPVGSAGVAAFATLFAMLAANALFHQPGRHPKPLLVTRPQIGESVPAEEETSGLMPVPLVAELQTGLAKAGYYTRAVDGLPGKATAAAIRAFQSDNGLPVDGEPSPRLLATIESVSAAGTDEGGERVASLDAGTVASDETGSVAAARPAPAPELVRQIQAGLAAARVAELKPDGILGEQTRRAIRTFESLQGLPVTGEPDPALLQRLKAMDGR